MSTYFDHVAGRRHPADLVHGLFAPRPSVPPTADTIELESFQVLEGEAAELSNRIFFSAQQRQELERALVLAP